nr:hypothetical protein [Stenotrophomonas maltophilia]
MHRILAALLLSGFLGGCATAPIAPPEAIASNGMNALSLFRGAGFVHVVTDLYLPGTTAPGLPASYACPDTATRIRIEAYPPATLPATDACALIDAAARHAQQWYPERRAAYTALLVPQGTRLNLRTRSLRFRVPHLTLAMRVYDERARTEANLVDLVAHETFHTLGFAAGDRGANDERTAYYAGLCTQLAVLGTIPEAALPGAALASDNADVVESADAAYRVRREIYGWLQDGEIRAGTPGGERMQARCRDLPGAPATTG